MELVVASNNQGKIREYRDILEPLGFRVFSLEDKDMEIEVEETGATFAENAILKAQAVHERTHGWVLSDDSGLSVDALNGECVSLYLVFVPFSCLRLRLGYPAIMRLVREDPEAMMYACRVVAESMDAESTGSEKSGRLQTERKKLSDYYHAYLSLTNFDPIDR